MDKQQQTEIEAAVFQRLVEHFRTHTDVQNIDVMNLASFCRNCLSKWYQAAADERGIEMSYDAAREVIYGMPYSQWKEQYQTRASDETMAVYKEKHQAMESVGK
ncbi:MAG: DUF1244 domain-containing protein [Gammaproteobacteria bacterium]|nr:DUF1244 domain-containing protein [Gammaproteobacteria bacterium]MDH3465303.1 DUF1244 domain-containing protein [Gammaproteobacteria bacterium]